MILCEFVLCMRREVHSMLSERYVTDSEVALAKKSL
jgi:hypothetical protein